MNTWSVAGCSRFFQLPLFRRNREVYRKSCYKLLQSRFLPELCKSKRSKFSLVRQGLLKTCLSVQGESRETHSSNKRCGQTCRPP
jgi:hypothetical protein